MFRLISSSLMILALGICSFWAWNNTELREELVGYIENGEFLTLEARYTPEQIMQSHQHELIVDSEHSFRIPRLKFQPYLLMEVKYADSSHKSKEGIILWSLLDGEMILDMKTWEKSTGFNEAILARANGHDFKILNTLVRRGGSIPIQKLQEELNVEYRQSAEWIDSVLDKNLVIQSEGHLKLHIPNARFNVKPQTKINQWLVSKPYSHALRDPKKYSPKQIEKIALAAFGTNFKINHSKEMYLPIYTIDVENSDGSIISTEWNALTGQRLDGGVQLNS